MTAVDTPASEVKTAADSEANSCNRPDARRSGQSFDDLTSRQDRASAEKANAGGAHLVQRRETGSRTTFGPSTGANP